MERNHSKYNRTINTVLYFMKITSNWVFFHLIHSKYNKFKSIININFIFYFSCAFFYFFLFFLQTLLFCFKNLVYICSSQHNLEVDFSEIHLQDDRRRSFSFGLVLEENITRKENNNNNTISPDKIRRSKRNKMKEEENIIWSNLLRVFIVHRSARQLWIEFWIWMKTFLML